MSRFGVAAAKACSMPLLDSSRVQGGQGKREQAGTPLSSARPLVDVGSLKPSRPAPAKAKMDKQAVAATMRQVGDTVAKSCDGLIKSTGGMWKHMAGEQYAECHKARSDDVKEASAPWSGEAGRRRSGSTGRSRPL